MMPQLLQQMQNPSVQQLMSNPEALQAIMQVGGLVLFIQPLRFGLFASLGQYNIFKIKHANK
jgi:ubiquilin